MASVKNSFDLLNAGQDTEPSHRGGSSSSSSSRKRRAKTKNAKAALLDFDSTDSTPADFFQTVPSDDLVAANLVALTLDDSSKHFTHSSSTPHSGGVGEEPPHTSEPEKLIAPVPEKSVESAEVDNIITSDDHQHLADASHQQRQRQKRRKAKPQDQKKDSNQTEAVASSGIQSAVSKSSESDERTPGAGANITPAPILASVSNGVEVETELLEQAARRCGANEELRLQQWHDWTMRAQSFQRPGPQFGAQTWKQVFLRSRALEICLESCLYPPLQAAHRPHLQALLAVFLGDKDTAQVLTNVAGDLAQGLGAASSDTSLREAAQHALAASLAAIKDGESGAVLRGLGLRVSQPDVHSHVALLDSKVAHLEHRLQALGAGDDPSATLLERTQLSEELVQLSKARLAVLLPDEPVVEGSSTAGNGPSDAFEDAPAGKALRKIRQLVAAISQLKGPALPTPAALQKKPAAPEPTPVQAETAGSPQVNGSEKNSEERRAELNTLRERLSAEASSLYVELAAAEAEVARLRTASAALEGRRQSAEAQLQELSQVSEQGAAPVQTVALGTPVVLQQTGQLWCAQQLGIVHTLEALIFRPSKASENAQSDSQGQDQEAAMMSLMGQAVVGHLQALAAHLLHQQQRQHEVRQRTRFCQDKLAPLEAQAAQLRSLGKHQLALEVSKPKEAVVKMLKAREREAEDVMAEADSVEAALTHPSLRTAVALLPPQAAVHMLLHQIGNTLHQMRLEHSAILAGPDKLAAAPGGPPQGHPASSRDRRPRPSQRAPGAASRGEPAKPGSPRKVGGKGQSGSDRQQQPLKKYESAGNSAGNSKPAVVPSPVPVHSAWGNPRTRPPAADLADLEFQEAAGQKTADGEDHDVKQGDNQDQALVEERQAQAL
eukprot:jgi/Mesen1/1607/ME000134S00717